LPGVVVRKRAARIGIQLHIIPAEISAALKR